MSELPRTDDLPRSDDGFDPARVEEAFASFAERVHELESVAVELRAELRELRADRRTDQRPDPYADEDWPADRSFAVHRARHAELEHSAAEEFARLVGGTVRRPAVATAAAR